MQNVFVGRQPIFDDKLNVFAYELLYRAAAQATSSAGMVSGDDATTTTIINTFVEIGLDKLVRDKRAAINLTEKFILEENQLPFTPKQVILEILEDVPVTPALIVAVEKLVKQGFVIALDDYIYNPSHKPLLELASIVKIDLMALDNKQLLEHVKILKKFDVKLVAEKIETPEEFIQCRDLGFDYFQGYFLSRPQIISAKSLPTNRLTVLNLLAVLHNPDSDTDDLTEAINTDVTTSYKLLKLINSAAFNLNRNIESIQQGVLLLGRRKLMSWASMLSMSSLSDRPSEILRTAMTRAKMCELLAEKITVTDPEGYFTVGLFSALDLLLQQPLPKLLEPLPLSKDVLDGLLQQKGLMGKVLSCVLAYEISDWMNVSLEPLSTDEILIANIEAVTWANAIMDTL